jgi:hypothetical protein
MTTARENDARVLVALFRTALETVAPARRPDAAAALLERLAPRLRSPEPSPDALFYAQCVDDWGAGILGEAVIAACARPDHIVDDLECD